MSSEDPYGTAAHHLILRAKLSSEMKKLLPYDGPLVRLVFQEQHDLNAKIGAMEAAGVTTSFHERWPSLIILTRVVHQNKRCLLAYHSHRLGIIRTAYWEAGGAMAHVLAAHQHEMSSNEIEYLRGLHDSVVQYRDALSATDVVDLTMGIEEPPRESVFTTVETVIEPGPLYIESGLIDFKVGQRYILLKHDIEHLILQGYLREV
ncbi:GINS complex Psf1 component [Mycena sanguinolenta]|nr:GINS complex Psf1 component [Mycena sanguinolenta]KAJ6456131.1 GINS complex Psf1 component [Mycena sanguinolenta]KAJ6464108.1 GINS complex Psf1 component [Mycena sanguinolenta]KAJ6465024.1 GINS complex Psf1 component [Mycena sanguinolenta]KAJ6519167.1 GINS complex Psf1 component [Mycena sanguinolenta]